MCTGGCLGAAGAHMSFAIACHMVGGGKMAAAGAQWVLEQEELHHLQEKQRGPYGHSIHTQLHQQQQPRDCCLKSAGNITAVAGSRSYRVHAPAAKQEQQQQSAAVQPAPMYTPASPS